MGEAQKLTEEELLALTVMFCGAAPTGRGKRRHSSLSHPKN